MIICCVLRNAGNWLERSKLCCSLPIFNFYFFKLFLQNNIFIVEESKIDLVEADHMYALAIAFSDDTSDHHVRAIANRFVCLYCYYYYTGNGQGKWRRTKWTHGNFLYSVKFREVLKLGRPAHFPGVFSVRLRETSRNDFILGFT